MVEEPPSAESDESNNQEKLNLEELSFEQLKSTYQEIQGLAETSFTQTENGFLNAFGNGVFIKEIEGIYKLSEISRSLNGVHIYLATENTVLNKGSANKEEMLQAIKVMLEKLRYRII